MFNSLQSQNEAEIEDIEGCMNPRCYHLTPVDKGEVSTTDQSVWFKPYTKIPKVKDESVMFKPLCGLFNQDMFYH